MFPKGVCTRTSLRSACMYRVLYNCKEGSTTPKLRTAYILWDNLMMTSLHSYVAFAFVRVSPKKDDEDCANYLIELQSMMPAGVLAGDAREPPGSYRGAISYQGLLRPELCMQPGALCTLGRGVGIS